jgi:hypothetical protein
LRFVNRIDGFIAIGLAVVSMGLGIVYQNQIHAKTECQARINQIFLATIKERAELNNEDMANINKLLLEALNSAKNTKAQNIAEAEAYQKELDKINGELAKATYPDLGSC